MRKIFVLTAASLFILSCSDNVSNTNEPLVTMPAASTARNSSITYKMQLPYINVTGDNEQLIEYLTENEIDGLVDDTSVSWEYFDNIYTHTLPNSIKQQLAYIILVKKDLIGFVNNNPGNVGAADKLSKYTEVLVNTNYIGYTALYEALNALNNVDSSYGELVQSLTNQILSYSASSTFHADIVEEGVTNEIDQTTYDKIEADLYYLSQIAKFKE